MASSTEASALFEQAMGQFQTALKTGLKIQEETIELFTGMLRDPASLHQWQDHVKTWLHDLEPLAQKNMDEAVQMMNENAKTSLDLLQKAFDTAQSKTPDDLQAKTRQVWETLLGNLRANTQTMLQANARAINSWRKAIDELAGESVHSG